MLSSTKSVKLGVHLMHSDGLMSKTYDFIPWLYYVPSFKGWRWSVASARVFNLCSIIHISNRLSFKPTHGWHHTYVYDGKVFLTIMVCRLSLRLRMVNDNLMAYISSWAWKFSSSLNEPVNQFRSPLKQFVNWLVGEGNINQTKTTI